MGAWGSTSTLAPVARPARRTVPPGAGERLPRRPGRGSIGRDDSIAVDIVTSARGAAARGGARGRVVDVTFFLGHTSWRVAATANFPSRKHYGRSWSSTTSPATITY